MALVHAPALHTSSNSCRRRRNCSHVLLCRVTVVCNLLHGALQNFMALFLRDDLLSWHASKTAPRSEADERKMECQLRERVKRNVRYVLTQVLASQNCCPPFAASVRQTHRMPFFLPFPCASQSVRNSKPSGSRSPALTIVLLLVLLGRWSA